MSESVTKQSKDAGYSISGNTPSNPTWGEKNAQNGIKATQVDQPDLGLMVGVTVKEVSPGTTQSYVTTIDLDDYRFSSGLIPIPFIGHGLVANPLDSHKAVMFEKRGKGACELDLKAGELLRPIETVENRKFYGHGAYSQDGSLLFATETITEGNFDGVIVVRNSETLQIIGEFPSYGARPHDCHLIDGGKTMAITNGGGFFGGEPGSLTFVDIQTQRLLAKLEIDIVSMNAGHVALTEYDDIAVVSAPKEGMNFSENCGGISLGSAKSPFSSVKASDSFSERMLGETLSVCIDEKNRVAAATTPDANLVSFWSFETGKLLHTIELPMPKGITLTKNGKFYMISYGRSEPIVSFIDVDDFKPVAGYDLYATMTGSHIFSHSFS